MTITVSQDDIDEGKRRQVGFCPIALALKRTGYYEDVAVSDAYIFTEYWAILQTWKLRLWRLNFDKGRRVGEISFEVPDP